MTDSFMETDDPRSAPAATVGGVSAFAKATARLAAVRSSGPEKHAFLRNEAKLKIRQYQRNMLNLRRLRRLHKNYKWLRFPGKRRKTRRQSGVATPARTQAKACGYEIGIWVGMWFYLRSDENQGRYI